MQRTLQWVAALAIALIAGTATAQTVEYMHTDALGSVVAITDSSGAVIERNQYEPYGSDLTGIKDGPGFTGHVSDAATGLSYMQQRYYDPTLGSFLSVDPVTAFDSPVLQFNRYRYANGNPFRFTDPDGRLTVPWGQLGEIAAKRGAQAAVASQLDSPLPGPGDVAGLALLAVGVAEVGYTVYQANQATPEPAKSPEEAVNDAVSGIREGKGPAPGKAGERGELQGEQGGGDADWEALGNVPGAEANGPNNIKLPDGSNANRHSSTRPYADGPAAGTDTIKHYPANSSTPSTTIRYPEK